MKKILLIVLISIFSFQLTLADAMELRVGVNTESNYDEESGSKEIGYGAKVEVMKDFGFLAELGIGAGYQVFGEAIEYWGGDLANTNDMPVFSAVPFYGVVKLKLGDGPIIPYVRANIGYAFPSETQNEDDFTNATLDGGGTEDLEIIQSGGAYYGVGAGIVIGGFIAELIYEVNSIDYELTDSSDETREYDKQFSRITLELGFRMNLEGGFGSAVSFEPATFGPQ